MRRAIALAFAGVVLFWGPSSSHAACGDGALQAGEACDASAPGGDAGCPGRCVPSGLGGACTCATPSSDARRYVAVAGTHVRLARGSVVGYGHVAVTEPAGQVVVGRDASVAVGSQLVGDAVRLQNSARIGRLFANTALAQPSAILGDGGPFPVVLPLVLSPSPATAPLPPPGGEPVTIGAGETRALAPGNYGTVTIGPGGKLVLDALSQNGAGVYAMASVVAMTGARLIANNPVVVSVADRLGFADGSFIGGNAPGHLVAGDVDLRAGRSVRLGAGAVASARIDAPTIRMGNGVVFSGRLRGGKISVGRNAKLFLEGGCGDGLLDPGEQCDTSVVGGDVACPGACIAGDPAGLGRLTEGQPGQCTCHCDADADCDDHNACNGRETCQNHACVLGVPPDCNDHNPCTRDCDPAVGCVNTPVANGTACSDRNPCTEGDTCQDGACTAGAPVPDGTACSDGDRCTVVDVCRAGACVPGPARDCSDDNSCSIDSCDPATGCVHTARADGEACDDRNACTTIDTCRDGACIGSGPRNCDDGNPCTTDGCDPTMGCEHAPLPDATPCGTGKACRAGVCS